MIQVREYATLTSDTSAAPSLDLGVVSQSTLDWLVSLAGKSDQQASISVTGSKSLKLDNYVGYLESPSGEAIEVLPKTDLGYQTPDSARKVLQKMLRSAMQLPPRETTPAQLSRINTPLHEWIFAQFLGELKALVTRGLRFDYERIEEESRFIRGQLNVATQQRQHPGRADRLHIRHDLYTPNRIENRLLKTALDYTFKKCRHPENWRVANELTHIMESIEPVRDPLREMEKWSSGRLVQSYATIKPWCQLLLEKLNPNFQQGKHRGIALMFPMERLFEEHVAAVLGRNTRGLWELKAQARSQSLVRHQPLWSNQEHEWFNLRPDLMLYNGNDCQVLDTKWKLLDQNEASGEKKYLLSQADFYQLYAYGHKYQSGQGDMMLIFPKHEHFTQSLPCFRFDNDFSLWVVPFCVEADRLVAGDWETQFPGLSEASRQSVC